MIEINEMKNVLPHITQVESLISAYGSRVVAGLLGVTEQAMRLWLNEPDRVPRRETLKKIADLFAQHEAGGDLRNVVEVNNPLELLIKNTIDNTAMNRVILMALAEILATQRGEVVTKVLSELLEAVERERASGL